MVLSVVLKHLILKILIISPTLKHGFLLVFFLGILKKEKRGWGLQKEGH